MCLSLGTGTRECAGSKKVAKVLSFFERLLLQLRSPNTPTDAAITFHLNCISRFIYIHKIHVSLCACMCVCLYRHKCTHVYFYLGVSSLHHGEGNVFIPVSMLVGCVLGCWASFGWLERTGGGGHEVLRSSGLPVT